MKIIRILLLFFVCLAGGGLGGFAAFSYLIGNFPFGSKDINGSVPVYVTERKEVAVQENKTLVDVVGKVAGMAAEIKITSLKGVVTYGSGAMLTSDGIVAVPYSLFPPRAAAQVSVGGKKTAFQVIKRDKTLNLVILKLEGANWPTSGFYQMENLKIGQRVFLAGTKPSGGNFTNEGIVRDFTADIITTTIYEKAEAEGAPAFDIEGNIMGIADIDKAGQVSLIPISKIKEFNGL